MFSFFWQIFLLLNSRSNPGSPTQPKRPDFIGVNPSNVNQVVTGQTYYDFPLQHQQQSLPAAAHQQQQQLLLQQQQQMQLSHHNGGIRLSQPAYGSPQRRFLSEGELVRGTDPELSYAKSNNTVDNIRELAGSPQRGVYMWKDTSPGYSNNPQQQQIQQQQQMVTGGVFSNHPNSLMNSGRPPAPPNNQLLMSGQPDYQPQYDIHHHRSNPTSPTQQLQYAAAGSVNALNNRYPPQPQPLQNNVTGGAYHPALRGGVPVFPPQPSPQVKRKATPTRPMSFVRALEMTDSIEMSNNVGGGGAMNNNDQHQLRNNGGLPPPPPPGGGGKPIGGSQGGSSQQQQRSTTPTPDRASVYDMNYEISV